jgi:hypothetical protein
MMKVTPPSVNVSANKRAILTEKGGSSMYQIKGKEKIFVYTGPDGSGRKTIA